MFCLQGNADQVTNKVSLKEITLFVTKLNQTLPFNLHTAKLFNMEQQSTL